MTRFRIRRRRRLRPGDRRLLHDLGVVGRALDEPRAPARTRLDRALGPDLARAVLDSLDPPSARRAA